jgi:REP element-mobilizing transposase RayT
MTKARRDQFDAANPPWVHVISRCVRRAYLCGVDAGGRDVSHRKAWIEKRLQLLAESGVCAVAGYAVMSNHLHVVLRMQVELVAAMDAQAVARTWLRVWPRERLPDGSAVAPNPQVIERCVAQPTLIATWRDRLADLGWTMKALKEDVSRRANREDRCTGTFWEGRYKSVVLLDQAALTGCMAYVDLNPIRAGIAATVEGSGYTGALTRLRARQAVLRAERLRSQNKPQAALKILQAAGIDGRMREADRATWLTPVAECLSEPSCPRHGVSLDEYLTLLDATARVVRGDKRGATPHELAPILQRLDLNSEQWWQCMRGSQQFFGSVVGNIASRLQELARRGGAWLQNRCALFVEPPDPVGG